MTPRMTYYTRVLSNATGQQVAGYASTARTKDLYYGRVDALRGGESEYVVQFSIWNNEGSWSAHSPYYNVADALNCRLTLSIPNDCRQLVPFLYARCSTLDPEGEYVPLDLAHPTLTAIRGTATNDLGVISGEGGDHADVETKIVLKKGSTVCKDLYAFGLDFSYDYE